MSLLVTFCKCSNISFRNGDLKVLEDFAKKTFFILKKKENNKNKYIIIDFHTFFSKMEKQQGNKTNEKGVSNRTWLSWWKGVTRIGETVGEGAA